MVSLEVTWEDFLKIIKEEAGSQVVETWFKAVSFEKWDIATKTATLRMPNQFVQNWVKQHYIDLLKTHLARLLNTNTLIISFVCTPTTIPKDRTIIPASPLSPQDPDLTKDTPPAPSASTSLVQVGQRLPAQKPGYAKKNPRTGGINPIYQFDKFVVGPSNSLAQAAAYAVSQQLGKVYNPLYIYGGTGLGKTHLLHAIGNEAKKNNPKVAVHYETSDRFMTDFINSIRFDKTHQFRSKYKKLDLLLVDDVQFFSNKEQTQETFFHIFNMLHEQQKQIIITSDTFPREIAGLQNRLKSRMGWGLVVDIQTPDLETKIAILKKKADENEIHLDDEVACYIASRVISNIRELEGSLIRVGAFGSLTNQKITVDLAKRVLAHLPEEKRDGVVLNKIISIVAKHYDVSITDLRSKKRHKTVALARQAAFFLMKKHSYCSLQAIGTSIGGRDHSTVIHSIGKIEKLKEADSVFRQKLHIIEQDILSS